MNMFLPAGVLMLQNKQFTAETCIDNISYTTQILERYSPIGIISLSILKVYHGAVNAIFLCFFLLVLPGVPNSQEIVTNVQLLWQGLRFRTLFWKWSKTHLNIQFQTPAKIALLIREAALRGGGGGRAGSLRKKNFFEAYFWPKKALVTGPLKKKNFAASLSFSLKE